MVLDRIALALQEVLCLEPIGAHVLVHHHAVEDGAAGFGVGGHGSGFRLVSLELPTI
jgi:hypothetical protein